jgi:hypothetical protein
MLNLTILVSDQESAWILSYKDLEESKRGNNSALKVRLHSNAMKGSVRQRAPSSLCCVTGHVMMVLMKEGIELSMVGLDLGF